MQTPFSVHQLTMIPIDTTIVNGYSVFKFLSPQDETVLVSLDGQAGNNNSLFTKFLTPARLSDYDFQGNGIEAANQENLVPNTDDGPYYSLATHEYIDDSLSSKFEKSPLPVKDNKLGVPPGPQDITVTATILPFSIRNVSPERAGNAGKATLFVNGAKFQTGATVRLVSSTGTVLEPMTSRLLTRIAAIFDLQTRLGYYDIRVTNPDTQTTVLEDGFEIVSGGGILRNH